MTEGPALWLGDVARAVSRLRPADAGTADAIARLLGFETTPAAAEVPAIPPDGQPDGKPVTPAETTVTRPREPAPDRSAPDALDELPMLPRERPLRPAQQERWETGDALDEVEPKHLYVRREHEPLFERRRERALLHAAVAVDVPGDELDVPAAVEAVASARPMAELPLLPRRSLARGVHLLVDDRPGMEPFRRDVRGLIGTMRLLAGRNAVTVRRHDAAPLDPPYVPPPPGTPVLALSDLGRAPVEAWSLEEDWIELAAVLRAQDSELIALNPYGDEPVRGAAMPVVRWDRSTTVGAVLASRERVR